MVKKTGDTLNYIPNTLEAYPSMPVLISQAERFSRLIQEEKEAPTSRGIFKKIAIKIKQFEDGLCHEEEVGVMLASFGQSITIHVNELSYIQPSIIIFRGVFENSQTVELLQHVNQLNFLLLKVPRLKPDEPRRPIGFAPWPDESKFEK